MRSHNEEIILMTPPLSDVTERISLEDLAMLSILMDEILRIVDCRTYDFNITSDTQLRKGRHIV